MRRLGVAFGVAVAAMAGCFPDDDGQKDGMVTQDNGGTQELGPDRQPIIFWRIKEDDAKAVAALLDAGTPIEITGGFDSTPLIQAAIVNHWDIALLLLERGANPLAASRNGMTAPFLAHASRVQPGGTLYPGLKAFRDALKARGVDEVIFAPPIVKTMLAEGRWPPQ